jgi:hypothetical protein
MVEVAIGLLYAIGALNQAVYVLRDSSAFYTEMADHAWLAPVAKFVEEALVSNSVTVIILVVAFEATLALAILTGGPGVHPALIAGGVFSIIGALTGSPAETVGYTVLAIVHFLLASARTPSHTNTDAIGTVASGTR